ncbi:MAG: hypothetical protein AAFX99_24680, partial [Myxococcota bacterium]
TETLVAMTMLIALMFVGGGCPADSTTSADTQDAGTSTDSADDDAPEGADTTADSPEQTGLCNDLEADYTLLVETGRSCQVDAQCQTREGMCGVGLGDCHEAVNTSVTQEALDQIGEEFGLSCTATGGASCSCPPPPPSRCEEGLCTLAPYCEGGRNIGDVWLADDGCSLCSCTFDGVNCRDEACRNPCVDVGLPTCPDRRCDETITGEPCHPGAECGNSDGARCSCGMDGTWVCTLLDPPVEGCDAVCLPPEPVSCAVLAERYDTLLADHRSCTEDSDCVVRRGSCNVGLGQCYEAVQSVLPQASLNALEGPWFEQRCSDTVCTCDPAPPAICDQGQCALGRFCGDYDLGDQWTAEDGCNTCTCTLGGAVCTNNTCGDPCAEAELPPCPVACPEGLAEGQACTNASLTCGDSQGTRCACDGEQWQCTLVSPPVEGCDLTCRPSQDDTCDRIVQAYDTLLEASTPCANDNDCQWLYGQCGLGLGGCYEAVNTTIAQTDLGDLGAAFLQEGCPGERCSAASCGTEPLVRCVEQRCEEVEYCAGRVLGEVWENGCSVCTCTVEGALCDNSGCPTVCEQIEEEYAVLVEGAQGCTEDLDCQILNGHCGVGDCFSYVNLSITQAELDVLNVRYNEEGCVDLLCHCTLPFTVSCSQGRCKPVDR